DRCSSSAQARGVAMLRPILSPEPNEARRSCKTNEPLPRPKEVTMAEVLSPLPGSHTSIQQVAGAINTMIAERAAERLKAPQTPAAPPLEPREPGVYFGLSAADYHADTSLGSSDLKRILQAPAVYWHHSHMNPERQPSPDSRAKQKGRALHKLVLEGEEAFA